MNEPCPSCPWRVNPHGKIPNMTASTLARLRDLDARPLKVMACHLSPEDKPFACRGFLAVHGEEKPGVRLAVMLGVVAPPPYTCEAELVSTTAAMLHNAEQL